VNLTIWWWNHIVLGIKYCCGCVTSSTILTPKAPTLSGKLTGKSGPVPARY
jgi:hypothetical protein